jgi:hypothetical protein
MMPFASWIKHPFDVAVQRSHDADPREHCRPVQFCDQDQGFHGRLHSGVVFVSRGGAYVTFINGCVNQARIPMLRCAFPGDRGKENER